MTKQPKQAKKSKKHEPYGKLSELFPGVYTINGELYTKSLVPGRRVYGEKLIHMNREEYRRWDPFRSKLAAAIKKGLKTFPFKRGSEVLYLGASAGTTISHLSDICIEGTIFGVEISPYMMEKLLKLAKERENIVPVLADARKPQDYADVGEVDILYQDVSQPDQPRILKINAERFLKRGGDAFLALKAHSIDVTKEKEELIDSVKEELEELFDIKQVIDIAPFDEEHYFLHMKRRA